jgi:hypothetical protein
MREPAYRLYNCERCGIQVRICQRCDHGNVYCAGECAGIRRRESLKRAQRRYQRSRQSTQKQEKQWPTKSLNFQIACAIQRSDPLLHRHDISTFDKARLVYVGETASSQVQMSGSG